MHKPYAVEMRKRAKVVKVIKDNTYLNKITDFCWEEIKRRADEGYVSANFIVQKRDVHGRIIEFAELKLKLETEFEDKGYKIEVAPKDRFDISISIYW